VVISPHTVPRSQGVPRPLSEPSSDSASAKPMEMPAPTEAAMPTRNVSQVWWVANAAANSGASEDETARRVFVLQFVQPGLVGLMDGSVSTLAPLFAAAFATHHTWETFLVGMAASVGAGISMGFAEALSDDGSLSGRGTPWLRGAVCGVMTTIGGLGHTLPYLIPDFLTATIISVMVVAVELAAISYIRYRYMDTPCLAGILIGSS